MLTFVKKYGRNVHSQNNEDGVIAEICGRLSLAEGHAVEVGGNDGRWMSNTAYLLERGWSGQFIEAEWSLYLKCATNWQHRSDVNCICSRVDGHNINAFVKDDCDLLSLDTDGGDYNIFAGLKAKPRIVVIEIDSSLEPTTASFNADGGASYGAMVELAVGKGYMVVCHTGNLVLVDDQYRDLFPDVTGNPLINVNEYFNRRWLRG